MGRYSQEVLVVPNPRGRGGAVKRALQLRSLASLHSFERTGCRCRRSSRALTGCSRAPLRRGQRGVPIPRAPPAPAGACRRDPAGGGGRLARDRPRARPSARAERRGPRGASSTPGLDWRKLREGGARRLSLGRRRRGLQRRRPGADPPGAPFDEDGGGSERGRCRALPPPRRRPPARRPDVLFFGLLSTLPNVDGLRWFVQEVWPRITRTHPYARLKILGKGAPPEVQALAAPGIEVTGFVEDLRPHLASAAAVVVPLRLGGGTRLEDCRGDGHGPAGRLHHPRCGGHRGPARGELLVADMPRGVRRRGGAAARNPASGARLGSAARRLAEERYSWEGAATAMEGLFRQILDGRAT